MIAQFVCTSTQALDPGILKITGTSPLTLLLYLQTLVDFESGQRTLPYSHGQAAAKLGVTERTIRDYFVRLIKAGLITARRLSHGVTFAITRPAAPGRGRKESPVHFHGGQPPPADERPETPVQDRQNASAQPSRGENPDSESTNQRAAVGGGGPEVGGHTALAPPSERPVVLSASAKIEAVAGLLEAGGHDVVLRNFDKTAIKDCTSPPEDIYACFDDIVRGRFGTDSQRRRVNVERAIEALPGWRSERSGVRSPRGTPAGQQDYIREAMARAAAQEEAAYGAR